MLRYLEKITSLKNLSYARPSGQIATLLMLVMVGVLVMIMVTVNLGKVSNTSTSLSNAADSAALYLASQLATKSTQLYQGLGNDTKKCQKGGFLSLILAIIVAIIFVAIAYFAPVFAPLIAKFGTMMVLTMAGAIGGAIGGAVGGGIAGTGVLQGALQGAMIGAAIGSAASAIATAMAPATTSMSMAGGTMMETSLASQLGLIGPTTTTIAVGPAGVSSGIGVSGAAGAIGEASGVAGALGGGADAASLAAGGVSSAGGSGAINAAMAASATTPAAHAAMLSSAAKAAMNVLGVGAKFYNESVDQKMTFAAISAAAKSTQNLPEKDRYRENVFLQALSQTVDDPRDTKDAGVCQEPKDGDGTMKCDPYDSDGDGNKKETVPYFQYWWDRRMEAFKEILPELKETTDAFINETLAGLKDELDAYKQTYSCESGTDLTGYGGYMCTPLWTQGSLYRYGLSDWNKYSSCNNIKDCKKDVTSDPGENGIVIAVAEAMEGSGHKLDFYKKTKADMREDYEGECGNDEDCGELHDEVEVVTLKLMDFAETVKSLQKQSLDKLTSTWQTWSKFFYNEELDCQGIEQSTSDYYDQFQSLIDGDAENDFAGIQAWRDELKEKKKDLPQCKVEQLYGVSCTSMTTGETQCLSSVSTCPDGSWMGEACVYEGVSGYPCRMYRQEGNGTKSYIGYTIDQDIEDEFDQADSDLVDLISAMYEGVKESKGYQNDMQDIYDDMAKKYKDEDFDYGGINPITYRWSDSRCKSGFPDVCDVDEDDNIEEDYKCHSVEVRTSEFKIPWIDEEKSGGFLSKKVCMVLKDYCYDPGGDLANMDPKGLKCKESNNPVWVNISRKEAGNQDMGILGKWNFKGSKAQDELTDDCGNTISEDTEASENSCSGVDCSTVSDSDTCACYCFKQKNSTSKTSRKSTAYFIFRPKSDKESSNKWVGLTKN